MSPSFPKPATRATLKAAKAKDKREARDACRKAVLARDKFKCRVCDKGVSKSAPVHEIKFRSQGGSPTDPDNCVLLCWKCHDDIHCKRVEHQFVN